jgi:hypothetical protein
MKYYRGVHAKKVAIVVAERTIHQPQLPHHGQLGSAYALEGIAALPTIKASARYSVKQRGFFLVLAFAVRLKPFKVDSLDIIGCGMHRRSAFRDDPVGHP